MTNARVFIQVSGGVVNDVYIPAHTDGSHTVIDWDNIDADPKRSWDEFDEVDRAWIKENMPTEYEYVMARLQEVQS